MIARTVARRALTTGSAPCSRCFDTVPVAAGAWHAAEADAAHHAVCDRCCQRDDEQGWQQLVAWRRAAKPARSAA